MAIAIYEEVATGRHHYAESTSENTLEQLADGTWVLFDDTPDTPPPAGDPFAAKMAEVAAGSNAFTAAQRAALVPFWTAAEAVTTGTVRVAPDGSTIKSNSARTTRGSYDATEQAAWTAVSSGASDSSVAGLIADTTTQASTLLRRSLSPRRILEGPRIVKQLTAFQPGHGWTVNLVNGATWNLNDTSDAGLGAQCVSVVTGTTGARTELQSPTLAAFDLTKNALRVLFRLDPATAANASKITVYAGEDATNGYTVDLWNAGQSTIVDPTTGWFAATVDLAFASPVNAPTTKAAITTLRAIAYPVNGAASKVYFGGFALVDKASSVYPNGVIVLGFDDGWVSQFTAARASMDRYGMPGTAYVIQDLIATNPGGNYMTLSQLHQLEDRSGWEIAAHAATSASHNATGGFNSLTEAQLRAELEAHKRWLLSEGFRGADHLAYPQGFYNDTVLRVARDYFTTARTIITKNALEQPTPAYPLRMRCVPVDSSYSLSTLQGYVDRVKANGGVLPFYLHQIVTGATGTSTTPTIFDGLIDYIAAQGVPVRTQGEIIDRGIVDLQPLGAGSVTISAAEPKANSTASAGTATTAAAADHVHPRAVVRPADLDGYRGWSMDPTWGALSNSALSGGTVNVAAILVDGDGALSNLIMYVGTAAVIGTPGQCFAAIFDRNGNQLAVSADIGSQLTSVGKKTFAMTAATSARVAGEIVYGAILVNGTTTAPQFGRASMPAAVLTPQRFGAIAGSAGATTMPASFTPGSLGAPTAAFWMAVT